ncbi:MAG: TorF family putative porin [Colwellia sp.]
MKKTLLSITLSTLLASTAFISTQASAVEGLSANAAVTSNYLWRGISQSGDDAAVSGGIDYESKSGAYAGTWVSSLGGASEFDLYAGYAGDAGSFTYDVGYIFYGYPSTQGSTGDSDFSEVYLNIGFDALTLGVAVLADAEWDASFADDIYFSADYTLEVEGLEIGLHAGLFDTDKSFAEGNVYDGYDIGVSVSKNGFTFGVSDHENTSSTVYVSYAVDFDL